MQRVKALSGHDCMGRMGDADNQTPSVRINPHMRGRGGERGRGRGSQPRPGLRGDIQGLRAVAVLLVLVNHADIRGFTGGYVGVDVFFVISGFLITGILVREVRRTGRVSIADFYARRARRILPAASVVLLVVVLVSSRLFNYVRVDEVMSHVTWTAFFAANIHLAGTGSDYFAVGTFVSPVQHYWSLAVEEQFYLVWPPLIALVLFVGRRRRSDGPPTAAQTHRRLRRLAVAIALLSLASFVWSVWETGSQPLVAYYSTLTRGWELGVGALLALCVGPLSRMPLALRAIASWCGLVAIGLAAVQYSPFTPLPGYLALLPVLGSALVLAGGIEGSSGPIRYGAALVLDRLPMRWVGDISYSLYLWHWPLLVIPPMYLVRELRLSERAGLMAVAIVVSWLSYQFIEMPVRQAKSLSRDRRKALVMWPVTVAVVIAAVGGVALRNQPAAAEVRYVPPAVDYEPETKQDTGDPLRDAAGLAAELARAGHPLPKGLRPSLEHLKTDVSRPGPGCYAERDATTHKICTVGDLKAKRTIVLFGDSHVTMYLEPLNRIGLANGWKIVTFMKASCLPVDATVWRSDKARAYAECNAWRSWAYAEIAKLKPQHIIVSGLVAQYFTDAGGNKMTNEAARPVFYHGAVRTLKKLKTLAPRVSVLSGTPNLTKEPGDCLAPRSARMNTCAGPLDALTRERNSEWKKAAAATRVQWIDLVPWMCDARTCPVVIGNVIVYRDNNHITKTFAVTLQKGLQTRLRL